MLDRAITSFGNGDMKFFDWLAKNDARYRGIADILDTMIATRNDVAHGTFLRRVTLREVQTYRAIIYRLIGKIEVFRNA
jgi:hypothetical protein